jgi:hypothetical protein
MDDDDDRSDELAEIERLKMFKAAGWTKKTERRFFYDHIAKPVMTERDRIARGFHASLQEQGLYTKPPRNFADVTEEELVTLLVQMADGGVDLQTRTRNRQRFLSELCEFAGIDRNTIQQSSGGTKYDRALRKAKQQRPERAVNSGD